jgi:hypothetical protein
MALITFTRNYTDRSNDTGFQFEFYCDKCHNGHMSRFQPSAIGIGAKLLRAAGWVFGNYWSWGYAGDSIKDVFRGRAWDKAFETAVAEAKQHFRSCTRCGHWVCPAQCWNTRAGLCTACAPELHGEAVAIQAQVACEQLRDKARHADQTAGMDMGKEQAIPACPHCGARAHGGKFCEQCGKGLADQHACPKCQAPLPLGSHFCGECGTPAAA